ncbi:unnamed protein product [Cylindrotheca closterium]|uniref:DUF6824 domain-containing protein n=1 Tax=Cylindrotheca closterium TaxID=2856 RepID=A0AAD2G3C2_9STRA|nr:unnamed protein product [Cylindrotheca closterium]
MLSGLIDMLSHFNAESASKSDALSSTTIPGSSLFKSSDFSDLYQGEDWNLDSLEEAAEPSTPPTPILQSQEHIPKLFQSLDWDANTSSVDDAAIAQAVAMQHSFEEAIAPTNTPKPVPFADAFKSQDWTIGTLSEDDQVPIHTSMMDQTPIPETKPSYKAPKNDLFTSRDWLATEFLGTHQEVSISPAMFQLEEPTTTTTTTTAPTKTTTPAPFAAAAPTNWESMFIGQLQAAPVAPAPTPTATITSNTSARKRKRKKRPKLVPEHKTYVIISQHDVLLGRGGKSNHHPGNKRYREEVENFRPLYASLTTDEEKTSMSQALVDVMEQMGGRFLEEDKRKDDNGKNVSHGWYVVPNIVARRKASQALREVNDPEKRRAKRARHLAKKAKMGL